MMNALDPMPITFRLAGALRRFDRANCRCARLIKDSPKVVFPRIYIRFKMTTSYCQYSTLSLLSEALKLMNKAFVLLGCVSIAGCATGTGGTLPSTFTPSESGSTRPAAHHGRQFVPKQCGDLLVPGAA